MERYEDRPHLKIVIDQMKLNIGMIWTNNSLHDIKKFLTPTPERPQPELVHLLQKMSLFQLDPLVLIQNRLVSSRLLASRPKLLRLRLKLLIQSPLSTREKRLTSLRLLFLTN